MYERSYRKPNRLDYDKIEVGYSETIIHQISQQDVDAFAALTGDFNPLHLDVEYSRRTHFRKPVVFGMLSASFVSTMIGMMIPGEGALWTSQSFEFLQPAFVGDTIRVIARVIQKSPATRFLVLDVEVKNQFDQTLITGKSTVKVLQPEEEKTSDMNIDKKIILVTGGSKGIGAAACRRLAQDGHKIVVNFSASEAEALQVVRDIQELGGQAIAVRADVSKPEQVESLFREVNDRFGSINEIVHCAAPKAVPKEFQQTTWLDIDAHLNVQLRGAYECARFAIPKMIEMGGGGFVFLGSIFTDGVPPTQQTGYVLAKASLVSFARSLAVEFGSKGIRVNTVSPGMTQTDMIANIPEKTKMLAKMQTPLRRLAEPSDIADVISFLVSPGARHITGETIRVCGGIVMA